MKVSALTQYRGFCICRGAVTSDDAFVNPNSGPGEYNQLLYAVSGSGHARAGSYVINLQHGEITDLSALKGMEVTYTADTDMAAWIAFNPLLEGTRLIVSILNQPTVVELVDTELETFIVPIKGSVEVNGKTIEEFNSGRLLVGKQGVLTVPEKATCAIVKVVREVTN